VRFNTLKNFANTSRRSPYYTVERIATMALHSRLY
jgi:hypothetical protein